MAPRPSKRKNLSEDVFETLKRRILNWEYPPGRHLVEEELCQEFGVSRSPVREALNRLAAYGLLETVPHRGCLVKVLDIKTIKDLYHLRLALELYAVESLAGRPEQAAPVVQALRRDWSDPAARSAEGWAELDRRFHVGLAEVEGNALLLEQLEAVNERLTLLRPFDFSREARPVSTCRQHLDILERIEAGDATGARQAMRRNIEDSLENVEDVVRELIAKAYLGAQGG